jgi:protocatechuate 3,4-dioxygenase beta subunit
MQKQTLTLLIGALVLVAGGSLVVSRMLADDMPIVKWTARDEVEVPREPADVATIGEGNATLERSEASLSETGGANDERVDVLVRGRVIDKFKAPVPSATVWLDYGRGGPRGGGGANNRQRRVPDPVTTDREGRFAFQGQTFRNLHVWLQVAHDRYAPGQFDKDVGSVATEVDLGDLVLMSGGEVRGRVTDLDGNGLPDAELRLQPENNNALRMLRDRDKLLPAFTTDQNGFYRRPHVASGDWTVSATAKMHTEGRSNAFAVEEDQSVDVDDIRLGPGFEITGYVRNSRGEPIAKADVVMQADSRNRGNRGRGGNPTAPPAPGTTRSVTAPSTNANNGNTPWGTQGFAFGREHRTTTDAQGRFLLEHLPGATMQLQVDADGYLDYRQDGVDTTLGQPIQVAMQDGLRIEGHVQDGEGKPVALFAFKAIRVRGLPAPGQANIDFNTVVSQLQSGSLDEATQTDLRAQFESMRTQFGRGGRGQGGPGQDGGRGPGGGGGAAAARDLGKPERHADGAFVATGLQEGIYEVHVQSPDYARNHSSEVELRSGAGVPQVKIALDAGVYVAGVVLDAHGSPVRAAHVELRTTSALEGLGRGRGRNGGGNRGPGQPGDTGVDFNAMARELQRMAVVTQLTLETTTNKEGVFIVKHVPRGTYRLQADAKGFADASTDPFELTSDRSGFELKLGALGSIAGTVKGLRPNETSEAKVIAFPARNGDGSGNGNDANGGGNGNGGGFMAMMGRGRGNGGGNPFQGVSINADGSYHVDDLTPGAYVVRCWVGSTQDLMRELGPQFATLQADVSVRGDEVSKLDLTAMRPQVGTVAGSVLHNNAPATGFQVDLTRQDDNGAGNGGGRGGRGAWGGFGRTFQSAVAASGNFTIANVPNGTYRLRVQNNRRSGTLHEEIVQVLTDATIDVPIVIQTCSLRGALTRDDGGNVQELGGRITLLPGVTAMPENFGAYTRDNPSFEARVQNGAFAFDTLLPGGYLLVASVRGRERVSMPIVVQADQALTIAAGALAGEAANANMPGNKPGSAPGGAPGSTPGSGAAPAPNPPTSPPRNGGARRQRANGG